MIKQSDAIISTNFFLCVYKFEMVPFKYSGAEKKLIHIKKNRRRKSRVIVLLMLKVHKHEKFFSSDFEFFTILYLVKLKY